MSGKNPKRIAFICGSAERGRDGVGDYTRRLARACGDLNWEVSLISLNDPGTTTVRTLDSDGMSVMRYPRDASNLDRFRWLEDMLTAGRYDWVSLQFVLYAFHPKGLPWQITKFGDITHGRCHSQIMFHELWLGLAQNARLKHRIIGVAQRFIVQRTLAGLRAKVIHTHSQVYLNVLRSEGWNARQLPLFGNILPETGDFWEKLTRENAGLSQTPRADYLIAGVFGRVYPEWDPEQLFSELCGFSQSTKKKVLVLFFGRSGREPAFFRELREKWQPSISILELGERSESEVSQIINTLDFGIATTQWELIEKSAGVATIREHGIPVVVTRRDLGLPNIHVTDSGLYRGVEPFGRALQQGLPRERGACNVNVVAEKFTADLLQS